MGDPSRVRVRVARERDLVERLLRRLQLAEHPTAIGQVAEGALLVVPVALPAAPLDELEVDVDAVGKLVTGLKLVREVEERTVQRFPEVVLPAEFDRPLEQPKRLLVSARLGKKQMLRVQRVNERLRKD